MLKINIFIFISIVTICSCSAWDTTVVEGVRVEHTLYENLDFSERRCLKQLIDKTIRLDTNALFKLIHFDCGEAAGCYDLGFVITQIIDKIGEDNFLEMANTLSPKSIIVLMGLINAGLEYGDKSVQGNRANLTIENAYPNLAKQFQRHLY